MNINPYLTFPGTCEEAMNFYKECFNSEITGMHYFENSPMQVSESDKKKVMHASVKIGDGHLMASDAGPDHPLTIGSNISISVNMDDTDIMHTVFNKLGAGGMITFPIQDTFWGAKFGMLTDKFGINWMFNSEHKK